MPGKDLVLGINIGGLLRAYPFQVIVRQPLINDSLSGKQVLVVSDLASETSAIYDRKLEGRSLGFDVLPDTGDGESPGMALIRLRSFYSFWFAWSDFHPKTELYTML